MADSAEAVRDLSLNEISRMTNAQLKRALTMLFDTERREDSSNAVLLEGLRRNS